MRYAVNITFACCVLLLFNRCGSLINELDRIKNKATATTLTGAPTSPYVIYTVPADGTMSAPVQTYIDIVYDQPIDAASITSPGQTSSCSVAVAASYNDFANCGGTASVSGNTIRLSAGSSMPLAVILKVRASGIKGTNGLAAADYQSATGFSFTSPCGQHCFYSGSAPLTANSATGVSNFLVSTGTHSGKQIIIHGGALTTTLYDPATNQTAVGPTLISSPASGSHNFQIPSGSNAGHTIVVNGGGSAITNRYDPATGNFVGGPSITAAAGASSTSFLVTGGSYAGRIMTILGNMSTATNLYNNGTNTFQDLGVNVGTAVNNVMGTYGYRLDSGPNSGKYRLRIGGGGFAQIYDDAGDSWGAGTNSNCTSILEGFPAFRVNTGLQSGKYYEICGGGTGTNLYDQNVTSGPGTSLTLGANTGSITIPLSNNGVTDKAMVFQANNSAVTMIYSAATDTFSLGPNANNNMGASGSSYFQIQSGANAGRYFITLGGSRTTMYDPATGKFSGTRPFGPLGIGGNYFNIKTGLHAGKVMIISAGGSPAPNTFIYDPQTAEMIAGPNLAGGITAGAGSHNFTLTSGPHAGKVMLINAQNSMNSQLYDPATNTFAASGVAGSFTNNNGAGSMSFPINSGPQSGKYLVINAGGAASTNYYDPAGHSLAAGPAICAANTGALNFTIPDDGLFPGDQFIVCGGGLGTYRFDPTAPGVIAGVSLPGGNAGAGSSVIYLRSGVHAGKFLIIHAGSTSVTTLYQPSNDTMSTGPATTACTTIGVGSVSFEITAGTHKGKFLITLGALTPQTCLYDPATNTFAFGPNIGPHPGYGTTDGTVVFPTGGGIYPTAYVLVHGGFFGTFSHFFQY